jgi:hypothetical protein
MLLTSIRSQEIPEKCCRKALFCRVFEKKELLQILVGV